MIGIDKSSPYRKLLMRLICAINRVVPIEEKNQVLIVMQLDTEEKIVQFNNWIQERLVGDNDLQATEAEIVRAAVKIDKELL